MFRAASAARLPSNQLRRDMTVPHASLGARSAAHSRIFHSDDGMRAPFCHTCCSKLTVSGTIIKFKFKL